MSTQPYEGADERNYVLSDKAQGIAGEDDVFTPITGQDSARRMLERLGKDEPVFVLRGNDISAALFVRAWINLQELNPSPPYKKLRTARRIALAMETHKGRRWPT